MSWATLPAVPLHLDLEVWESSCSVPKAARDTAGPSTPLRSGRDDNSVAAGIDSTEQSFTSQQNCHPDRSAAQWRDLLHLFPDHGLSRK